MSEQSLIKKSTRHTYHALLLIFILTVACAFIHSSALAFTMRIPNGVTTIEEEAFYGDTSLDEVVLPEGIRTIGERAFGNSSLRKINLPASLEDLADNIFGGNKNVIVSAIEGTYAYQWAEYHGYIYHETPADDFRYEKINDASCRISGYIGEGGIVNIPTTNPEGLTIIGIKEDAFKNNPNIIMITIPHTVTTIGAKAFYGCTGVTKLVLPEEITIETSAFENMTGLREVTLPVDLWTGHAFKGVNNVETIHYLKGASGEMLYYQNDAYRNDCSLEYYSRRHLKSIDFEEGVTSICSCAYYWYDSTLEPVLENVQLPKSLISIGSCAFKHLPNLATIELPPNLTTMGSGCFWNTGLTNIIIPEGITEIPEFCFNNCTGLLTVELPKSLQKISDRAFYNCTLMTIPTGFEEGITCIGEEAFRNCIALTELIIPNTVTTVRKSAFNGCTGVTKLVFPKEITIETSAFENMTGLREVTLPVDLWTGHAFKGVNNVETIHYLRVLCTLGG